MNDANTPAPPDPKQLYADAMQRLGQVVRDKIQFDGGVDLPGMCGNAQARQVEIDAVVQLLVDKGVFTREEFFAVAAGKARLRANKISAPKLVVAGQRMNGKSGV